MPNRVLIVDDDPIYLALLTRELSAAGAKYLACAQTVHAAVATLSATARFDLLVSEVVIAREACFPLLSACSELPSAPSILAMTAKATRAQVFRLRAFDIAGFIEKPFSPDALKRALNALPAGTSCATPTRETLISPLLRTVDESLIADYRRRLRLTNAEADVLRHWCLGLDRQAIAEEKGKSINTIKTQVRSILAKAQAPSMKVLVGTMARERSLPGAVSKSELRWPPSLPPSH